MKNKIIETPYGYSEDNLNKLLNNGWVIKYVFQEKNEYLHQITGPDNNIPIYNTNYIYKYILEKNDNE